jgi:iron complex transport system substrate-binding protein
MPFPRRLVSLTCSNTEIVAALGCGDRLVGVDDYSDHPEELVRGLPRVGPDLGIDVEAVRRLRPDLVLASLTVPGHERVVDAIAAAGLPFIAPSPESLADVFEDVRSIGRRLGVEERAEEVAAAMAARLAPLDPPQRGRPSVAVQWWPKPAILAGRRSWVDDLIELAGGRNAVRDAVASRSLEPDELAALAPEAIVLSWCGIEPGKVRPEVVRADRRLAATPAVRDGRVAVVPEAFLGRPGPRLVEGYRLLCDIVREEPLG